MKTFLKKHWVVLVFLAIGYVWLLAYYAYIRSL